MACMAALFNEGRPGMLLEASVVQAQRGLISIMLELAEFSGCALLPWLLHIPLIATVEGTAGLRTIRNHCCV